ncbi:hypothetical protein TA3x_005608 [Tundrisphaera sp. TA3]|uniref:hypothetical protein n=1 Tax=Tundrisphaera sp. TA3 TaxID=3435775 RepID=UPI003EBF33E6
MKQAMNDDAPQESELDGIDAYWEDPSRSERESFDEEAIEASPHWDEIRSLSPQSPIFPGLKSAARWEHVRRKLGMEVRG